MRPLTETALWPKIAVYDIETLKSWTDVQLICHVDEYGNRRHFSTVRHYVDWLFYEFEGQHVWAHYGGRFDHRFLIPEINRRGWDFRAALSGGSIVLLTAKYGGKKISFADSFRIMPNALKAIGKTVGLEKLDVDRTDMESVSPEQTLEYCYRDCEIVIKGLQHMQSTLTSVNADFAYTLASIASRWVRRSPVIDFRRLYIAKKGPSERATANPDAKSHLEYDPQMLMADRFCLPAYAGGRVEMFKTGIFRKRLYYLDIVSSYPASMQSELPLYFRGFYPPPQKESNSELVKYLSHCGVTEATVMVPKMRACPLFYSRNFESELKQHRVMRCKLCGLFGECRCERPEREKRDRSYRLTFPYGIFRGRWTNIELMEALRCGATIVPHGQARFEGVPFLRNFVDTFYSLRKQAKKEKDAFRTYAYKILLNSLYGKLAETLDRTAYVTSRWEIEQAKRKGSEIQSTKVAGVYCVKSQEEGPFRHIAAGAYVTAISRLRLFAGIQAVYAAGGEVYYCDTDSIITDVPMHEIRGKELGQWNHEYTFSEIEILLPKVYRAIISPDSPSRDAEEYNVRRHGADFLYRCKGVPIVRENEPPDIPEKRWEAFKRYAETGDPEMAALLQRDGLSGFVQDIAAGTLKPRELPMLRCLQSEDKKREWSGQDSWPPYVETEGAA